jgi:hypothetical protein
LQQVLGDFLRIVLEVVNCILSNSLGRNPELVYALLHKQDMLAGLSSHPRLAELTDNLLVREGWARARGLRARGGEGERRVGRG